MNDLQMQNWGYAALEGSGGRGEDLLFLFGKKSVKADLHGHSIITDGRLTIEEIGNKAQERGIEILSITDHDTIKPHVMLANGEATLGSYTGKFVSGVEITGRLNGRRAEFMFLGFDVKKAAELIDSFEFPFLNRNFKIKRNAINLLHRLKVVNEERLTDKPLTLNDFIGLPLDPSNPNKITMFSELGLDVERDLNFSQPDFAQKIEYNGQVYDVCFDNFNSTLLKRIVSTDRGVRYLKNLTDFDGNPIKGDGGVDIYEFKDFNRFVLLADNNPFTVDDSEMWPTDQDIRAFAEKVGGVVLLAHPYAYQRDNESYGDMMVEEAVKSHLSGKGVDGIETWHGFNKPTQIHKIYQTCHKHGMWISMGSDSHGHATSAKGKKFGVGMAPGFEGEGATEEFREIELKTSTLHEVGSGEYFKKKSSNFEDSPFGK